MILHYCLSANFYSTSLSYRPYLRLRIAFPHFYAPVSFISICVVAVVPLYQRNLQLLLIEIYKTVNNLNPSFMAEVFVTNVVPYNLRGSTNLVLPKARTNLYGIDTVRFVGQKLWQNVPKEIKESQSLDIFKRNIKAIPLDCSCKLCKSYIANLGFL